MTMRSKPGTLPRTARRLGGALLCALAAAAAPLGAQVAEVTASAVSLSSAPGGRALLELELADGDAHRILLEGGEIRIDGRRVGGYDPGGALETAWRDFLRRHAGRPPAELGQALRDFGTSVAGSTEGGEALTAGLDRLLEADEPAPAAPAAEVAGDAGLAIAPGGLSFQDLGAQLERLRTALEGLGEAGAGADERLALIVHDDYVVPADRTVAGNLALLAGRLDLEGTVAGDALVLDGTLRLAPGSRVGGDVLQVGGRVEEAGGRVGGELLSLTAPTAPRAPEAARAVPSAPERPSARARAERHRPGPFERLVRNVGHAVGGLAGTLSVFLGLGLLGLIAVYFGRPQLERIADTARTEFTRSLAIGLAGEVAFFPLLLILVVLVITWLVLPFYVLGTALAMLAGYLAAAHAVGEAFAARRYRYEWLERLRRSNSYYYVLSGLALLLLPFALAAVLWLFGGPFSFLRGLATFAAWLLTWLVATAGLGAVILTRGGTQPSVGDARWPGGAGATGRPPPGGGGA